MDLKENFNHFKGETVSHPFEGLPPETSLKIEPGLFIPNDPHGVYSVNNLGHYQGMLLSLHCFTETQSRLEGSAVMVAPGIALTAAHVFEECIDDLTAGKTKLICQGYTPMGVRLWRVRHFTRVNEADLMILSMEYASHLPSDGRFVQAHLTTRLPKIGETVMIAGFVASDEHVPFGVNKVFAVEDGCVRTGLVLKIGVGAVIDHHIAGRPPIMPAPHIQVQCSASGGMSGGAAFDKDGRVFGILSTSLDCGEADTLGPSFVSHALPALVHRITPVFLPHLYSGPVSLLDMPAHLCSIDEREAVSATTETETGLITVEVRTWPDS